MLRLKSYLKRQRTLGQSLVELAFFFPILLIILSGVIEFGFAFNQYINLIEATREGARYAVDGDPCNQKNLPGFDFNKPNCHREMAHQVIDNEQWYPDGYQGRPLLHPDEKRVVYLVQLEDHGGVPITTLPAASGDAINDKNGDGYPDQVCDGNKDYYEGVTCVILQAASPVILDPGKDDIIISVYRVYSDTSTNTTDLISPAWPNVQGDNLGVNIGRGTSRGKAIDPAMDAFTGDYPGVWRLWGNSQAMPPDGIFNGGSKFGEAQIRSYFSAYIAQHGQSAGLVVVELWHHYTWVLGLPWITAIAPQGLNFYTYTIEPVPAAEPRPTPTNTPTPTDTRTPTPTMPTPTYTLTPTPPAISPTPTITATPTDTETPTSTPTDTPTPTSTPPCGGVFVPSMSLSRATRTVSPVWANGYMDTSASRIIVTLIDSCTGLPVTGWDPNHNGDRFDIRSSRGSSDRIAWEGDLNGVGQYAWVVSSLVVGTSNYNIQVDVTGSGNWQILTVTDRPSVDFVCIDGVGGVGFNAQSLQFAYSNRVELQTNRRLVSLNLQFTPRSGLPGPFNVTNIAWSSTGNIIWEGPQAISGSSPLVIGPNGWNGPGTGGRSIHPGVSNMPLQFSLGYGLANSGVYTLVTTWDDGNGNNICTSAPVVYSAIP